MASSVSNAINKSASTTSSILLGHTTGRKGLILTNTSSDVVYLNYDTVASPLDFVVIIPPNSLWEMPESFYDGVISVVFAVANGKLIGTELS